MFSRSLRRPVAPHTTWLAIAALAVVLTSGSAYAGPFAFVANRGSDDVTVVDTWSHTVAYTLPTASSPADIVASPDGATIYVATDFYVTEIDLVTLDRVDHPYVGGLNEGNSIVIHPNGRKLWVSHRSANFVSELDLQTRVMSSVASGVFDIRHLAISASGAWVFGVTQLGDVMQLDTASRATALLFDDEFPFPTGIATSPGSDVAIASDSNLTVEKFSVTSFGSAGGRQVLASGFRPGGVASASSANYFVARPYDNLIHRTFGGGTVMLPAGAAPLDVAHHDDSLFNVSANLGDVTGQAPAGHGSVSFFTSISVAASVPVGREPRAVTIAAERGEAVIGDPSPARFPSYQSGSRVRRRIEVVSVGDDDAFVWDVSITGPDAAAFQVVSDGCRHRSLGYQQRCAVEVEFTAIPKPPPWWAGYLRYYFPSYSAYLAVDIGAETLELIPMQGGRFVKEPVIKVLNPVPTVARVGLIGG